MGNNANFKLGRLPSPGDHRTLQIERYETAELPVPPVSCRWDEHVPRFSMGGNDEYGDCVTVTAANELLLWRSNASGDTTPIPDNLIIRQARIMGGLEGYDILTRLKYWRKFGMWGNRIGAFASSRTLNPDTIKSIVSIFGTADVGVALPLAWQDADIWDIGNGPSFSPGSWGLHSVPIIGYDGDIFQVATWAQVIQVTTPALERYFDERYAVIDRDWFTPAKITASGYDLESLQNDLALITAI